MFEFIKRLFQKKQLPPKQPVVLTGLQEAEMQHYSEIEWPKPDDKIGMASAVFFINKDNCPTQGVVKAIKKQGCLVRYRVAYNSDSEKLLPSDKVFRSRDIALMDAIGEHWKSIQRYYKGLQNAKEASREVILYTLGKVQAHKEVIAFLEAQKEQNA